MILINLMARTKRPEQSRADDDAVGSADVLADIYGEVMAIFCVPDKPGCFLIDVLVLHKDVMHRNGVENV